MPWRRNSRTSAATPKRSNSSQRARRASGHRSVTASRGTRCCSRRRARVFAEQRHCAASVQSMRPRRRFSSSACLVRVRRSSRGSCRVTRASRRPASHRISASWSSGRPATPLRRVLDAATLERAMTLDLPAIGRAYLAQTRPDSPKPRFVDKMPLNFFYLGALARALPLARFVVLRRASARYVPQ